MGQSKKSNQKKKIYSVSSHINHINKCDRTSHWVGHSKLKELDINDLFEMKQMIEDLEAKLTGALKENSNTDNLAVAGEVNVDEAVTTETKASNETGIDLKDKQKTKAYGEKMNIDIEDIHTIEKIKKVYTKERRKIYEFIQPYF